MKTPSNQTAATTTMSSSSNHKKKTLSKASCAKSASSALFQPLNPTVHAKRLEQRRRAIKYGKNTVGYQEYCAQVPRAKRQLKSMTHPSTPDCTLDIPTKRWQGMIKAWRKALHQYDPPDLQQAFAEVTAVELELKAAAATDVPAKELEVAKQQGLLVDTTTASSNSPTSVVGGDALLDKWQQEGIHQDDNDDLEDAILDDSDDDLL